MRVGGAQSRPGFEFVCDLLGAVRLIPFVFNSSQTYVLVFGNQYMWVVRDGTLQTLTAQNITGITNANPAVLTYAGADTYANGDYVYVSGITGAIGNYLNGRTFKVANVNAGANTFELQYITGTNVNSTAMGAYTSGGTVAEVYSISTPYLAADIASLNFTQSADVVTITHPTYAVRDLSRTAHTSWTLSTVTFAPVIGTPANVVFTGGAGTFPYIYGITAVDETTGEESLMGISASSNVSDAVSTAIHNVTWDRVSGAESYRIYRVKDGSPGFVGFARDPGSGTTHTFLNYGYNQQFGNSAPISRNPFGSATNYPSAVCYYQQRRVFANTDTDPETIWMSRVGLFNNFTTAFPLLSADSITFTLAGGEVNEILHLINNGTLVALTGGGEWDIEGDESGIIGITTVNARQKGYYGGCAIRPVIVGKNILYIDSTQSVVRDILPKFEDIVDRTLFSTHLFDGYTLVDLTLQKAPHPLVWAVRSDGVLLGLTYVPSQEIFAWHRHDTQGSFENVCAVPEGTESALYAVANRTINGATVRYLERSVTRAIDDIEDFIAMDSTLSYDGRNVGSTTMTLSGGTAWLYTEELTITASASYFTASMVDQEVHLTGSDGDLIRLRLTSYTSATVMKGYAHKTVPASLRSTATLVWSAAIKVLHGLWHLEGEDVSVFADGFVVASPYNDAYTTQTVTLGTITLDKCFAVIHVGLPFIADVEPLNIDQTGQTLATKKKLVRKVTLHLEDSRGIFVGQDAPDDDDDDALEGLDELKIRNLEGYDEPTGLFTGIVDINIDASWNSNGRFWIRQVDPCPMTILAITPDGEIEGGR